MLVTKRVAADWKFINFGVCADVSMTISVTRQTLVNAQLARVFSLGSAGTLLTARVPPMASSSHLTSIVSMNCWDSMPLHGMPVTRSVTMTT